MFVFLFFYGLKSFPKEENLPASVLYSVLFVLNCVVLCYHVKLPHIPRSQISDCVMFCIHVKE